LVAKDLRSSGDLGLGDALSQTIGGKGFTQHVPAAGEFGDPSADGRQEVVPAFFGTMTAMFAGRG